MMKRMMRCLLTLICIQLILSAGAQDKRAQYPGLLSNAFFGVDLGYINYPFTNEHLAQGYSAANVQVPHLAIRITLFGYRFNKYLSSRITYMRPFNWVEYEDINGDRARHSVWMNVGALTMRGQLPLGEKVSLSAETGLGIVTRNGFEINGTEVVSDLSYPTIFSGAGLQYHVNRKWDLGFNAAYAPGKKDERQPHTVSFTAGFVYNMQPLPSERVEHNSSGGYIFPKQVLQVGYTTNSLGYGVNHFVSEGAVPIFWGGQAELQKGFSVNYQRNVFHTRKVFSLDVGTSFGYWESRMMKDHFWTLSVYPLLRFTALRTKPLDVYLNYSVAGPTYISTIHIDGEDTGRNFTFRDFMGLGIYGGKKRNLNAEINIGHFSNGNIFPSNAGVKIPLSFNLGYAF
jgi:hypothetical protein